MLSLRREFNGYGDGDAVKQLGGRMLEIATTGGGLPPEVVARYREHFLSQGYFVPDWQGEPGFVSKAKNFAKAVVEDVKAGSRRVSQDVYTDRMTLCRACGLYNRQKGTCGHPDCGCVMQRKAKWASQECPIGKWGKQITEEET